MTPFIYSFVEIVIGGTFSHHNNLSCVISVAMPTTLATQQERAVLAKLALSYECRVLRLVRFRRLQTLYKSASHTLTRVESTLRLTKNNLWDDRLRFACAKECKSVYSPHPRTSGALGKFLWQCGYCCFATKHVAYTPCSIMAK